MPKVTLLKPKHQDYTVVKGATSIKFVGGIPKEVSAAVAMDCQKKIHKGKPLFEVEGMPTIVKSEAREQKKTRPLVSKGKLF